MKMMKWALLGGAAFAVMSTSAQADELTALKSQLEALQARVTQLEAQPATSMPSGYSLLSMRDGRCDCDVVPTRSRDAIGSDEGITLSVLPTADVAPAAEISVSGEVRTLLIYKQSNEEFPVIGDGELNDDKIIGHDTNDGKLDVQTRGRLVVEGKADTAVGEVGAHIRIQGGNPFDTGTNTNTTMNQAYGWWKFAPNWQLIAGYWDTTAAIQAGIDWDFTLGATGGFSDKNVEQMRLVFTNGPFSFAIAAEDTDPGFKTSSFGAITSTPTVDRGNYPDIAGYVMYNNDNLMFQVAGVYQDDQVGSNQDWGVGAGTRIGLGSMFTLTAGAVVGEGYNGYDDNLVIGVDDKFWGASGGIIFNVAQDSRIEAGYGYEKNTSSDEAVNTVNVGFYWDPVSQVTLGLQGDWQNFSDAPGSFTDADADKTVARDNNFDVWTVKFGTWLRFK